MLDLKSVIFAAPLHRERRVLTAGRAAFQSFAFGNGMERAGSLRRESELKA
jgi:hypothetical protein